MADVGDRSDPTSRVRLPRPALIRAVWPGEAADFTPWLASHLEVLEALRIGELQLVQTEFPVPGTGRWLDILAQTPDGTRVAVENQYRRSDHDHLTRGLSYAVGVGAKALVVVAEEHAPEFVAVADYLNRADEVLEEEGISVFLVEVSVEEVEGYFVPRFVVVSRPNSWRALIGAPPKPAAGTVEQFLGRCAAEPAQVFGDLIDFWGTHGGVVSHTAASAVALRVPWSLGRTQPTAAFTLYESGQLTVNRGYLVDAGLFTEDGEIDALDLALDQHLPGLSTTDRNYYRSYRLVNYDRSQGLQAFAAWLIAWAAGRA